MDDRDIWYSAGIIDGEGYIGIIKGKRYGNYISYPHIYTPAVKVVSVTEPLIDFLHHCFGGYKSKRVHKNNQKNSYSWEIKNWNRVEEFLNIMTPYLRIKKPQAIVVKKFIDFRRHRRLNKQRNLFRYTQEELDKMEYFYLEIRKLNFRGKPPATTE